MESTGLRSSRQWHCEGRWFESHWGHRLVLCMQGSDQGESWGMDLSGSVGTEAGCLGLYLKVTRKHFQAQNPFVLLLCSSLKNILNKVLLRHSTHTHTHAHTHITPTTIPTHFLQNSTFLRYITTEVTIYFYFIVHTPICFTVLFLHTVAPLYTIHI